MKVTSLSKKATKAAKTKPGNKPREPITLKNLLLRANFLKGSEKVVITHKEIAKPIDIG